MAAQLGNKQTKPQNFSMIFAVIFYRISGVAGFCRQDFQVHISDQTSAICICFLPALSCTEMSNFWRKLRWPTVRKLCIWNKESFACTHMTCDVSWAELQKKKYKCKTKENIW